MAENKYVIVEKENGIATLTLNRPERMNSLIPPMRVEIRKALEELAADNSVRALILTGKDPGFCSGADVRTVADQAEMAEDEPQRALLMQPVATSRLLTLIRSIPKPVICALNGVAAGSGTGLALICDVLIASDKARFRVAFTRMGLAPEDWVSFLLPRRIGTHRALELAFTNDLIDAREMERIGLVNRVVPHDDLLKVAKETARKMFQIPPYTLALAKKAIYHGITAPDIESQMVFVQSANEVLRKTEDTKEAQRSMVEKREPVYKEK